MTKARQVEEAHLVPPSTSGLPPNFGLPFQLLASPTNFWPAAPTSGLPTPNFWPLNLVFPQLLASYPTSGMPPNFWPPPTSGLPPQLLASAPTSGRSSLCRAVAGETKTCSPRTGFESGVLRVNNCVSICEWRSPGGLSKRSYGNSGPSSVRRSSLAVYRAQRQGKRPCFFLLLFRPVLKASRAFFFFLSFLIFSPWVGFRQCKFLRFSGAKRQMARCSATEIDRWAPRLLGDSCE